MANRYGLGQADFALVLSNDQFLRQFAQTEAQARAGSKRIADAINEASGASQGLSVGFAGLARSAGVLGLAIIGVTTAVSAVIDSFKTAQEQTLKLKQAQFELSQAYKGAASEYSKFAGQVAQATNKTTAEVTQAVVAFGTLRQNFALTSDQIKTLTLITSAYSAKSGRDMIQSALDIQAAIRGEGEAVEKLGLTLGRDFVKNMEAMTAAQRKNFFTISDAERAQIIFAAALRQSNELQTTVADRAKSDLGTYDAWNKSVRELALAYGEALNPALQVTIPIMTGFNNAMAQLIRGLTQEDGIAVLVELARIVASYGPNFAGAAVAAAEFINRMRRIREAEDAIRDPGPGETGFIGPTEKEAQDEAAIRTQAILSFESQLKNALNARKKAVEEEADIVKKGIQTEIDFANKAYEAKINQIQQEKHNRQEAAQETKETQLAAIKEEQDASKEAHQARLAQLREDKETDKQNSTDKRDAAIQAIDVEKDSVEGAVGEQIHFLEIEKDAKLKNAEEMVEGALKAIDEEKKAQIQLIDDNIAGYEQQKVAANRAAEDEKDGKLAHLEAEKQKREDYYADRIRKADQVKDRELKNAEAEKDGKLRQLDKEQEKRQDLRRLQDRLLADQAKAREDDRDRQDTVFGDQEERIKRERDLQDRGLDYVKDGIKQRRTLEDRALDERQEKELQVLSTVGDARDKALDNEVKATKVANDRIIDEIDKRKDANEDAHKAALRQIDAEKDARIREIEERLNAVDQLSKSFSNENKIADLGLDLTVARNKGDITETKRIEEEIRRERLRQSYEAARDSLKIQKDAVANEIDAKKDALQEEFRLRQNALDAEKTATKAALDTQLDVIKQRTESLKSSYDNEKALVKDRYETIKQALQDQRFAEDEQFKHRIDALENQRYAEDQKTEQDKRRIEDLRKIEDSQFENRNRLIEDSRLREDKQLEERKKKIEDNYSRERDQIEETHDKTVRKLRDEAEETKRSFDDRKEIITKAYDEEKRRLQDLYDDPKTGILARLRNQREVTQEEYKTKSDVVRQTYEDEKEQIQDTYNGEANGLIPNLKRALATQVVEYDRRRKAVEQVYKDEQREIDTLYENLIKQETEMANEAEKEYGRRAAAVNAAYKAEQAAIYAVYDDPVTGLLQKQKEQHDAVIKNLQGQQREWDNWADNIKKNIETIMDGPLKDFIGTIGDLERRGLITPGSVREPGDIAEDERKRRATQGRGPGAGVGANIAGAGYNVLFPYDAPYNGPYGGALWAGGPTRHRGIDLTLPGPGGGRGSPIGAFSDARVVSMPSEPNGGDGIITQRKADGLYEYYGHMDSRNVSKDQEIKRGQNIGTLGASGLEPWNTPHLHYEVRKAPNGDPVGKTIDPRPFMAGLQNTLGGGFNTAGGDVLELRPFGPNGAVIIIRATSSDWYTKARQIANEEQFSDPDLFARQMEHESDHFAPDVIRGERKSSAGAVGIAQFIPSTAAALGVNPFNPIESLYGAAKYMRQLERRYAGYQGHTGQYNALWAYNAGEGNLQQGFLPGETRKYLDILLPGHAGGKLINEPTLMVGMHSGEMGLAGETGQPERLLGVSATSSYDGGGSPQAVHVPIIVGDETIANLIIRGHHLIVESGRNINLPGFAQ